MTTIPTSEALVAILDTLDVIACRAVSLNHCDDVAANKRRVIEVIERAELIIRLIETANPPGFKLVKRPGIKLVKQ